MKFASLAAPFAFLLRGLRAVFIAVFGRIGWQPPWWLSWLGQRPLTAAAILLALLASAGGSW